MNTVLIVAGRSYDETGEVEAWQRTFEQIVGPSCTIYDTDNRPMPYVEHNYLKILNKIERHERMDEREQQLIEAMTEAINIFLRAERIIFLFPLHNNTIPATLHTFFDYIMHAGITYKEETYRTIGLLKEKQVMICYGAHNFQRSAPSYTTWLAEMIHRAGLETPIEINWSSMPPDMSEKERRTIVRRAFKI